MTGTVPSHHWRVICRVCEENRLTIPSYDTNCPPRVVGTLSQTLRTCLVHLHSPRVVSTRRFRDPDGVTLDGNL